MNNCHSKNFINREKLSQSLSRYEHQFSMDDVIRNCDEATTTQKMEKYNKVMLVEAWMKENNPSYIKAFNCVQDPLERF